MIRFHTPKDIVTRTILARTVPDDAYDLALFIYDKLGPAKLIEIKPEGGLTQWHLTLSWYSDLKSFKMRFHRRRTWKIRCRASWIRHDSLAVKDMYFSGWANALGWTEFPPRPPIWRPMLNAIEHDTWSRTQTPEQERLTLERDHITWGQVLREWPLFTMLRELGHDDRFLDRISEKKSESHIAKL